MTEESAKKTPLTPLIKLLHETAEDRTNNFKIYKPKNFDEVERLNLKKKNDKTKTAYIVTAGETAIELGGPGIESFSSFLWTDEKNILETKIFIGGKDFQDIKEQRVTFAVMVLAELSNNEDPLFTPFESTMKLSNRLSGFMTRSIPGKLQARIGKKLIKNNFTMESMAQCILFAYNESFPEIKNLEIFLVADDASLVNKLGSIYNRARVISGNNRRLSLEEDGTISCDVLSCATCDEKTSCDVIRDVIRKK